MKNGIENLPMPETLMEAVQLFADQDVALQFMSALRWPSGVACCPRCGSERRSLHFHPSRVGVPRDAPAKAIFHQDGNGHGRKPLAAG